MNIFGVTLSNVDLWLLAIAGTCATWLILHKLSADRDRKNRHAVACATFRAAFLEVLSGLYPIPSNWPTDHLSTIREELKSRFPALQVAVAEFSHTLPEKKRVAFNEAWRMYHLGNDGRTIDQQDYWQYVPYKGSGRSADGTVLEHDNTYSYQDDFKKNIDHLLSFAKDA